MSESGRSNIISFSAWGILGSRNYHLDFRGGASIIVGPNGTGKSTFLNLLYLFISRQWLRLAEYDFEKLQLVHTGGAIELTKADLLSFEGAAPTKRAGADRAIARLYESNAVDLLYKKHLSEDEKALLAAKIGVPIAQLTTYRRYVQAEFAFARRGFEVDQQVQNLNLGEILYLPTYRRIEKDIRSIFPDIESRMRARMEEGYVSPRAGSGFKEIASFGMADIQKLVDDYVGAVRDFRTTASETASQEYIRDIVRGKIKNYSLTNLRKMSEEDIEDFKAGLDQNLLTESDRLSLRGKIEELRKKHSGQPSAELRYLGMFVEKLLAGHSRVKEREGPLRAFASIISTYLGPEKRAVIRAHGVEIRSNDDGDVLVPLDKLSSGEKQIVSVFSYLLLSGQRDFILIIDEPELSLSVPWQKRFIPDIISTGSCANVITVTHSPFVFDNELRKDVVDVRRLRVSIDG